MINKLFKILVNYFVKGLLVVLPIGLAIYFVVWSVQALDASLNLSNFFWINPNTGKSLYIPGLGILAVLVLILLAGIVVTSFITQPIYDWFNRWLKRFPVFNFIYGSIKDFTEAFVGDEKKFNEPVSVDIDEHGLKKIGFLTQKDLQKIGLPGEVAVYFPYSYSFAGQLVIVPASRVKPLNMSASDAMKLVVSGGASQL